MRPRYVINKGISKVITAKSRTFDTALTYTAVIYNPKYKTTKITAGPVPCEEINSKKTITFTFSASQTEQLREGFATIEIYDENMSMMVYRDNFAVIRKNSLQINNQ